MSTDLTEKTAAALAEPRPAYSDPWRILSAVTVMLAALEALTGGVLALYYEPAPERAYASVFYISNYVGYGWLIRSVHLWGAQLLMALAIVHMARALVAASYRRPREWSWVLGVLLLVATVGLGVTGTALRWDQAAQRSTSAAVRLLARTPVVADRLTAALTGADAPGAPALVRTYAAHTLLLPALLVALLLAHLWLAQKHSRSAGGRLDIPVVSAATAGAVTLSLLLLLVMAAPAALTARGYVAATPAAARPAWYLIPLHEYLRLVPPPLGPASAIVLFVLFAALPWIDSRRPVHVRQRAVALAVAGVALAAWVAVAAGTVR